MDVYYICSIVTAISAFISFSFSLYAYLKSRHINSMSLENAMYAFTRSSTLAASSLVPFFFHSVHYLIGIAVTMIIIQALDAVVGLKAGSRIRTYAPLMASIANQVFLVLLINN